MFVVDIERFKALCELYFLNTIQPEELEELKATLNSGETELRNIFNQAKKEIHQLHSAGKYIDALIFEDNYEKKEAKLKDAWNYSFIKLFFRYWFEKSKTRIAVAFAIFTIIGFGFFSFYIYKMSVNISGMKSEIAAGNLRQSESNEIFKLLQAKDLDMILLKTLSTNQQGYGRILFAPSINKTILQINNLPASGADKTYHLWIKTGNKLISCGTIPDQNTIKEKFFEIKNFANQELKKDSNIFITLEKSGNTGNPEGAEILTN